MIQPSNIAILLFSRTPHEEAREKLWLKGRRAKYNVRVANWLQAQSTLLLADVPFPIFHFTEKEQEGNTFGERFSKAFQAVFSQGYSHVISIGGDIPQLERLDWMRIAKQLLCNGAVLGPDFRGGCYLVGLSAEAFEEQEFTKLPWQSASVFASLLEYLQGRIGGETLVLNKYRDVNQLLDLLHIALEFGRGTVNEWLSRLLFGLTDLISTNIPFYSNARLCRVTDLLRGPPYYNGNS